MDKRQRFTNQMDLHVREELDRVDGTFRGISEILGTVCGIYPLVDMDRQIIQVQFV